MSCKKVRYDTKRSAETALNATKGSSGIENMNVYLCSCGYWHLGHVRHSAYKRDGTERKRSPGKKWRPFRGEAR